MDGQEWLNYELEKRSNYTFKTRLFPAIGCGKRLPVRPVYTAFEIERNLRKLKALKLKLSDSTMMRIAELCGSLDSFHLTRERPNKYVISALDSILRDDPAIDTSNYDAYSLFKVHEALTERFFLLFHGFEVRIRTELCKQSLFVFLIYTSCPIKEVLALISRMGNSFSVKMRNIKSVLKCCGHSSLLPPK